MNKFFKECIFSILFIVLISGFNFINGQTCRPYGSEFNNPPSWAPFNQGEISGFSAAYPTCTIIDANVTFLSGINSLEGLSQIELIKGDLKIFSSDLESLIGLDGLTTIEGDLWIYGSGVNSITGLSNLTTVLGNVFIENNQNLESLIGFQSLQSIGGLFNIINNPLIENLTGLNNLSNIGGLQFNIRENNLLTSLLGLEDLISVNQLNIINNVNLLNLNGLSGLIDDVVEIHLANNGLTSLMGLSNLTTVAGTLEISENDNLTQLSGLSSLNSVGSLAISNNSSLANLNGLAPLNTVNENLIIKSNTLLSTLQGFGNIGTITGTLKIVDCDALTDLEGIGTIGSIGGLIIQMNDQLTSLAGIENINLNTGTLLQISNNSSLSHCSVQTVCNWIAYNENNTPLDNIFFNAVGCNNRTEVKSGCNGYWLANILGNWEETANWSNNIVPTANTLVSIEENATVTIPDGTNAIALEIILYPGVCLVVNGDLDITLEQISFLEGASGEATIKGNGTIDGVSIDPGGIIISPGNTPGKLQINGNLTIGNGNTLFVELEGPDAGVSYDQLIVDGTTNIDGAKLNISFGYEPAPMDYFDIIIAAIVTGDIEPGDITFSGGNVSNVYVSYLNDEIVRLTTVIEYDLAVLTTLTVAPDPIVVGCTTANGKITYNLLDDSGVFDNEVTIMFPDGSTESGEGILVSGSDINGTYEYGFTMPLGMDAGSGKIITLTATDVFGNVTNLSETDLLNNGFDPTFEVIVEPLPILTINPSDPVGDYVADGFQIITFDISGVDCTTLCSDEWTLTINSSGTDPDFTGLNFSNTITVDESGNGSIDIPFLNPSGGNFVINASITNVNCTTPITTELTMTASACLPEYGITFTSQQQIDDFPLHYPGCVEILGNLWVMEVVAGNIIDLNTLSGITKVGNSLVLQNNANDIDFSGLSQINSVGVFLNVLNNPNQTNLNGLHNISTVGSSAAISNNPSLNTLNLNNLESIQGRLILNTLSLDNINGLNQLGTIADDLLIDQSGLWTLIGLENLTSIGGDLRISNHPDLNSLEGLDNASLSALKNVNIFNNSNLSICNVESICNFLDAGGTATLSGNTGFCVDPPTVINACAGPQLSITPLDPLNTFITNYTKTFNFAIKYATKSDCQGVWTLTITISSSDPDFEGETITQDLMLGDDGYGDIDKELQTPGSGDLTISVSATRAACSSSPLSESVTLNSAVCILNGITITTQQEIDDFAANYPSCIEVDGIMTIGPGFFNTSNEILNLNGLSQLSSIEHLVIVGNNNLASLQGLQHLIHCDILEFFNNADLNDLSALGGISELDGLNIGNNDALQNLQGMNNLTAIQQALIINDNASLSDISVLASLHTINGFIDIQSNNVLPSLNGLHTIDPSGITSLTIINNQQLSLCATTTICTYLNAGGSANFFSNRTGCNSTSEVIEGCLALPVELIDFKGFLEHKAVTLNWQTSVEINNDLFQIEHSLDGINFATIGQIDGNGTSTIIHDYSFVHDAPYQGINYYRLKQIDFDGSFEYSNIVSVKFHQEEITISPNPTHSIISINGANLEGALYELIDLTGRTVARGPLVDRKIDLSRFSIGIYLLKIQKNGRIMIEKVNRL